MDVSPGAGGALGSATIRSTWDRAYDETALGSG